MKFASRLSNILPSVSMKVGLSENIKSVVNLGIGISDLKPPEEIHEIILKGIQDNRYPYTPSLGSLRARKNLFEIIYPQAKAFPPDEFMLVSGAKWGISLALSTISNPGDTILLMEPYWLSYPAMCEIQKCNIDYWKPSSMSYGELTFLIDDFEKLIQRNKPSVFIFNNPNNPSGKIFNTTFVKSIIEICLKNEIWLIIDSVYRDLVFDVNYNPYEEDYFKEYNIIEIGSVSKSLSLPGLRIGYIRSNKFFIQNADLINQHQQTCINFISNLVCEGLSTETYLDFINKSKIIYNERYDLVAAVYNRFNNRFLKSAASFYMLVELGKGLLSGEEVCNQLAQKESILATPGIHYGDSFSTFIRICLTVETEKLEESVLRMNKLF